MKRWFYMSVPEAHNGDTNGFILVLANDEIQARSLALCRAGGMKRRYVRDAQVQLATKEQIALVPESERSRKVWCSWAIKEASKC